MIDDGKQDAVPELILEPEAAEILHMSQRKLRQLRAGKRIGFVKIGRKAMFTPEQLCDFIEKHTEGTIAPRNARSPRERRRS